MMVSANRFRSIGWIALLLVCAALVMVMAFRVNALRSQVHRTEQQIVALRKEKLYLETEVETRANQQQLKLWNDVEFGYVAPTASQYLSNERQLAAFAKPDGPDSPEPIRVASADDAIAAEAAFPSVIAGLAADIAAPVSKSDDEEDKPDAKPADAADRAKATANLGARLAMVTPLKKDGKDDKPGKSKAEKNSKAKDGDKKAGLAKAAKTAKDDAAKPGKGAKLAAGKTEAKAGKAPAAKSEKSAKSAKPAPKPAKGGSKSAQ
ncbi:hypothetical protein NSE01_09720 [Novosphingobium sediminis]|uniref:Uncharacterized protein n=1 Tax=Novosphingobium sediminis TaxID=707214 RepID=A0A512AHF9_9SPHN|nr:hypothetical protein [Novosphingobium sediminis]GEN99139.1 hypothetical protein NSE01_09720 [Novosphingobium sediminis]